MWKCPLTYRVGWAEQDPARWWQEAVAATGRLKESTGFKPDEVAAIGISYQMHGLVCLDRPARCSGRPSSGATAGRWRPGTWRGTLGEEYCQRHLLNLPGNFTASKLAWVRENEPEVFAKVAKILLPGDWLAFRMTGRAATTASGLSEGILWDFPGDRPDPGSWIGSA